MATKPQNNNSVYGLYNPVQDVAQLPIIAQRNPTTSDQAAFGTLWVNNATDEYFVYTSKGNWAESISNSTVTENPILIQSSSADVPAVSISATVSTLVLGGYNGATITTETGPITIDTTNQAVNIQTGTGAINIGADAYAKGIFVGSTTAGTNIVLNGGNTGLVGIVPLTVDVDSGVTTVTANTFVGNCVFGGLTTASGATEVFTINNTAISGVSGIAATVSNNLDGGGTAAMGIVSVIQSSGQMIVTAQNFGAGALAAGDDVMVTFQLFI